MNETNQMAPPLDEDLSKVDTSFPLLADGIYQFKIDEAKVQPTKDGKGKFIHLKLSTTMPAISVKGENLVAGINVFDNRNLVPTGKATWDMIKRGVGEFIQAIEGGVSGATLSGMEQLVPTLQGRTLKAKVGYAPERIDKATGRQFKANNEILLYIKA